MADADDPDVLAVPRPTRSASKSSLKPRSSKATLNNNSLPHPAPSAIRPIVTVPPWARDEPLSPAESVHDNPAASSTASRPASRSDVLSLTSDQAKEDKAEHRWFPFTRRNSLPKPSIFFNTAAPPDGALSPVNEADGASPAPAPAHAVLTSPSDPSTSRFRNWGLRVNLPPHALPATLAQSRTPGWESPWVPKIAAPFPSRGRSGLSEKDGDLTRWQAFKKRARRYLLSNVYAPLFFRFINITLTTAALALAAQLRIIEKQETLRGSLGPSPTVVVIFAPLTLAHVMFAVYLEYFGRPLGLWRTSAKLAHTLMEVIFICLWSGALALTLNDFFAYFQPCSTLIQLSDVDAPGDSDRQVPCNHQLALICLVAVGLLMYCLNLVISLFRIFEKVKVHNHGLKAAASSSFARP